MGFYDMNATAPPPVALHSKAPGSVSVEIKDLDSPGPASTPAGTHNRQAVFFNISDPANNGALLPADGEKLMAAAQMALEKRIPIIGHIASSGAHVPSGVTAAFGWGRAAKIFVQCSGVVPMIFTVTGPAVSGPALLCGIADFTIMLPGSYAFVSGPHMVQQFTGIPVDVDTLGGADIHRTESGAASFMASSLEDAQAITQELLALLPSHNQELPPRVPTADPKDRKVPEAGAVLPASTAGGFDMKAILRAVADDGYLLEIKEFWAQNMLCAFGSIGGWPVGFVANQPQNLAGTLNIAASQKAARFVSFCDAFNIPIVTFVDTPGFQPGKDLEWRGMIRHGAQLVFAYAQATVPRVCVTVRKSYGGAYIVMDSKKMGNDVALAWPTAEIAVMGAKGAVGILHRGESEEARLAHEEAYAEKLLNPYVAAERGSVDRVIDPSETRIAIIDALDMLSSKSETLPKRRHGNSPL